MVEVMKIMAISFKRSHACTAALSAPSLQQATSDPYLCGRLLDTHGQVLVSLLWGHCSFLLGLGAQKIFVYALQESVSPVLCKFWWLYGGINVGFLQEGLCHMQVYCTQSPCPCSSPLLTCTSGGDTQTQFDSVSVGSLGPGMHKVCVLVALLQRIRCLGEKHRRHGFDP